MRPTILLHPATPLLRPFLPIYSPTAPLLENNAGCSSVAALPKNGAASCTQLAVLRRADPRRRTANWSGPTLRRGKPRLHFGRSARGPVDHRVSHMCASYFSTALKPTSLRDGAGTAISWRIAAISELIVSSCSPTLCSNSASLRASSLFAANISRNLMNTRTT